MLWALPGLPEFQPGMSVAAEIVAAAGPDGLRDGDVLVVTSKIVSKAEDCFAAATERQRVLVAQTVRVVAKLPGAGASAIVENHLGLVMAAAGIDESNVVGERLLVLPADPDRSASEIAAEIESLVGVSVGVIVSDTVGRPWRVGQTDIAIGAARVQVVEDFRGSVDGAGKPLAVTQRCIADEIAAAADLVKGKTAGLPVAVVRGMGKHVGTEFAAGARSIVRRSDEDLFRLGTREAIAEGRRLERAERHELEDRV